MGLFSWGPPLFGMTQISGKPRVLLVDDESDITNVFKRAFESRGYEADVFNDPVKAAYHFKPDYYDACILDIRMPGKNGFELARDIWRLDNKAQVCFLTAFTIYQDEAKKLFRNLHSHCFLTKPMFPSALVDHVAKHLVIAGVTSQVP